MSLEETLRALDKVAAADDSPQTLPAACYHDREFFELEVEKIHRPGWHPVARWDEIKNPGDFKAVDLFGDRVVVVRGKAGELHAFSGVCLHRGFPFAEGSGNTQRFTCPYHLWTYGIDGRLIGAPFMQDQPGFDREKCKLPEIAVAQWQGFILVCLEPDDSRPFEQLGELDELLAPFNLSKAVRAGVSDWDSPWNWKIMVENFMESYHHIGPHVENLGKTNPGRGTHHLDVSGPCVVLENPAVDGAAPFYVFNVFPTLMFSLSRGEAPFLFWYEMQIDRHDHIHLRIHLFLAEELAAQDQLVALLMETIEKIHREDIPVCLGTQRGTQSRQWRGGQLSAQEATLHRFHKLLAQAIT